MFIVSTHRVGEKLCVDVELAIKNRMMHKWSILKTSTDKQSLEKFLSELTVS